MMLFGMVELQVVVKFQMVLITILLQQKKKLIIDALLLVLDETDSGILENFEPLIKIMIPTVVDNLIDVEKGKIKLNKGIRVSCCCIC